MPHSLTLARARCIWSHHQRLGGAGEVDSVPGGWIRSLGGVDPYLALLARDPKLHRADVDGLLSAGRLWVVPGVRGCIWLVPESDRALALRVSEAQARRRLARDIEKLEVPTRELDVLAQQVVAALADGPKTPKMLRSALPEGAVRSLGAAGKKIGHSTTLPTALRHLEWAGKLRRLHRGGRLDTNRYEWSLSEQDLVAGASSDPAAQALALAHRYFAWAGPATLGEFVAWSQLGKRIAKAAVAEAGLVEVAIEGVVELAYATGETLDAPVDEAVYLLPTQDNLLALRDGPARLVEGRHHERGVIGMGGRVVPLGAASWLLQRPIVHLGTIIGLWEYDPETGGIVHATFEPLAGALAERLDARAKMVGRFMREELEGNAKAVAIDNERSIRKRIDALR